MSQTLQCDQNKVIKSDNYNTLYKAIYDIQILIGAQKVLPILPQIPEHLKMNNKYVSLPFEHMTPLVPITHRPVRVTVATCSDIHNSNIMNYIIKYFKKISMDFENMEM